MSESRELLAATFFDGASVPLAVLESNGTVLILNAAWKSMLAAPAEAEGKPMTDLLVPADAARFQAALGELGAHGGRRSFSGELDATATGRTNLPILFHMTKDPAGRVQVAALDDQEAARLRELESARLKLRIFSHVIDNASVVVWATDADGIFTLAEGKGLQLPGVETSTVGMNIFDIYKDQPDVLGPVVRALGGEDTHVVTPLGPVVFDSWILPLRGANGAVEGAVGFAMEVTETAKREQELRDKLELIERQSATIRALATPIIQVWDEVLCLPVIGTVDSARTADMMQGLLEAIVREQARYAIVDLTGVEVVDTSTADHLIRLFRAAKVLGVDGILCGIRPAVAQTVVALGLDLASVRTMRSLRDALVWCIGTTAAKRGKRKARSALGPITEVRGDG